MRLPPNRVSVVIPARDAAPTIGAQLDALGRQTYGGEWEVVIVDSASTDGTGKVAEAGTERVSPRVIRLEQPGTNRARNAGAAEAQGELLVYCDADDEVDAGWLEHMVDAALGADIICGALELRTLNSAAAIAIRAWPYQAGALPVALGFRPFAFGSNFGIWRDVLDDVGGFDEQFLHYTDVEMSWRVQHAGHHLAFAPDAIVHYRLRSTPGAVFRQQFTYAFDQPRLYRRYAPDGMPRSSMREALRVWVVLLLQVIRLGNPSRRVRWLRDLGTRAGRVAGSLRHRTRYL